MRKSAVLLVGVLVLFIFLAIALMQSLVIVQRIAHVSGIMGSVYLQKAGEADFRPITAETRVLAGTLIKTGPDGQVDLNWVDGSRVRLAPDTRLRVRKCSLNTSTRASTSLFDLDVGRIWIRVLELLGERSKFEIRTPTATAGVRGTVFSVEVDQSGRMDVAVYEGAVAISGGGEELTASAGESASIGGGAAAARSMTPSEREQWQGLAGFVGPRLDMDEAGPVKVAEDATTVTVSGVSEPGAQVTVDGTPVELDRNIRFTFTAPVPADAADLDLVIEARDSRGGVTSMTLPVTRSQ